MYKATFVNNSLYILRHIKTNTGTGEMFQYRNARDGMALRELT